MKKIAIAVAGIVLACGVAHAGKPLSDDAEVRGAFIAYDKLWQKHEPAAISQLFTDNGIVISPDGKVAQGKPAIQALTTNEHTGKYKKAKIKTEVTGVRMLGNDWAYVEGKNVVTDIKNDQGEKLPEESIPFTALMTKKNGQWLFMDARPTALMNVKPAQ